MSWGMAIDFAAIIQAFKDITHKSKTAGVDSEYVATLVDLIEGCAEYLRLRVEFENWVRTIDQNGDCWNISSICAEYVALQRRYPSIYSIYGKNDAVMHLECVEELPGGVIRTYMCNPYNRIPAGNYSFYTYDFPDYDSWQYCWNTYLWERHGPFEAPLEFQSQGVFSGGQEVRNYILSIFPKFTGAVKLVDFEAVQLKLMAQLGLPVPKVQKVPVVNGQIPITGVVNEIPTN